MTRLEFGLGQKSADNGETKSNQETKESEANPEEQHSPTVDFVIAEIDLIGSDGDKMEEPQKSEPTPPYKTVDWLFVRRVALAQIVLASLSILCLLVMLAIGGVTWFKFATFFWSTFVMLAGYAGYKSYSTRNYYYVLTYLIMAAFQSLMNWFALVYSTYSVYYLDSREMRYYKGYCFGVSYKDVALVLELMESLTMMGTVITGVLGAKACCAGLGRLLTYQDKLIQQRMTLQQ